MKKILSLAILAAMMISVSAMATGWHHSYNGTSGVFVTSGTDAGGYFTGGGDLEVGAMTLGGGEADSSSGSSAVGVGSEQYADVSGYNGNALTQTDIGAVANQTANTSNASAGSSSLTTTSVTFGSATTYTETGAIANAISTGWHHH